MFIATATAEGSYIRSEYYPDVRDELLRIDMQLDQFRMDWTASESELEREEIERKAWGLSEARTAKQFRLNRHHDEIVQERYSLDDSKDWDSKLPESDSEWLSWKVNKFIKNISHRSAKGHLYVGRVLVRPIKDGRFEFRCYAKGCSFHANHYVGTDHKRVELRLTRILAHWYKHA